MFGIIESPCEEPSDKNIYMFLTMDEILGLNIYMLSGNLAGIEMELPEYKVELVVKKKPKSDVQALEIKDYKDAYYLTLNSRAYPDLLKNGRLGGRVGNFFKYDIAAIESILPGEELHDYLELAKKKCSP